MSFETKQCKNCNQDFLIESSDSDFYERFKVPPPTLCPDCRLQRRLSYRNERRLYRRACDLCKKTGIAVYPQDVKFPVYCAACWWSDNWDAAEYSREYDPGRSFFEQFKELFDKVPQLGMPSPSSTNYNSDYTSWVDWCKNCYLVFGSSKCEDALYSELLYECKNSADSTGCSGLELSYQCINSDNCYKSAWCVNSSNCNSCYFCFDCRACNNCFLSYNQRNKSYLILNKQYPKEEWESRMKEILGSHSKMEEALGEFRKMLKENALHKFANAIKIVNSIGNNLVEAKNTHHCFDSVRIEDCRYVSYGDEIKDCMDSYAIVDKSELCYENLSTRVASRGQFTVGSWDSNVDVKYSHFIVGGSNLFGCVGLRKKQYHILNKQYNKEDYEKTVERIVADMKEKGEYGEFFPISISSFGYNETLALDYYPMTKEQAVEKGYNWRDDVGGTFGKETVKNFELPDNIRDVKDEITKEIMACGKCGKNFKVTPQELGFYRAANVPLPRRCSDCRYYERLTFRNPRKLWHRKCGCAGERSEKGSYQNTTSHSHGTDRCPNEFQTSYDPERSEMVYCEECYNAEVV